MMSTPAAVSHGCSFHSQKPSKRPQASVAEVERRRPGAADAVRPQHERLEEAEVEIRALAAVVGKAGGEQRLPEQPRVGHGDGLAVQRRARAPRRAKKVSSRIGSTTIAQLEIAPRARARETANCG